MSGVLVVAKAPVPGRVKTRLAADIGYDAAAKVAAAALLDTLDAAERAVGRDRCHLALDGELADAVRGDELQARLEAWTVTSQRGEDFSERLAQAHADAGEGPVAQIGMDTPQVTADDLRRVLDDLTGRDAVLGPADDGGWWVLARRDPQLAQVLAQVPMSTPTTYDDTRAALEAGGRRVGTAAALRDVDTTADAEAVAEMAPGTRFALAWRELSRVPR